jgi:GTP-binding protein HflX
VEFSGREFLLTDTVGFIDRLPLKLIDAFHSTLEETIYSDVIILVVDFSEPLEMVEKKNTICLETINRIGASGIPLITALNKVDLLSETEQKEKLAALGDKVRNPVLISALLGTNLGGLKREVLKNFETLTEASFNVPLTNQTMQFLSWVHNGANVKKTDYTNNSVQVVFEAAPAFVEGVRKRVGELNGKFEICTANRAT